MSLALALALGREGTRTALLTELLRALAPCGSGETPNQAHPTSSLPSLGTLEAPTHMAGLLPMA